MLNIKQKGSGKKIVLLHGWGFDHQIWDPVMHELSKNHCVYAVDLPGFGQTELMPWEKFKKQLLLQIPDSFCLVGWSLGGLFATRLAIESIQVSHLVNVASTPCFRQNDLWPGVKLEALQYFLLRLRKNPEQLMQEFVRLQCDANTEFLSIPKNKISSLEHGLNILIDWDLRALLQQIKQPTCYIFGRLDAIAPKTTYEIMRQHYPQFDYHFFQDSAHMPFLSETTKFIKIIEAHIQ